MKTGASVPVFALYQASKILYHLATHRKED